MALRLIEKRTEMRALTAEDDFTSRLLMQKIPKVHGPTHVVVNGLQAVRATRRHWQWAIPTTWVFLAIMRPGLDGQGALKLIRRAERAESIMSTDGAKIFTTTALDDIKDVRAAHQGLCDAYPVRPVDRTELEAELRQWGLIES